MWKPFETLKEWRKFKAEKLKKWLEAVELDKRNYREADTNYKTFMQNKKFVWEMRKNVGLKVSPWEKVKDPKRLGGFRGQKWFDEMLWDLKVAHGCDFKTSSPLSQSQWSQLLQKIKEFKFTPQRAFDIWEKMKNQMEMNFDIYIDLGPVEVKTIPFEGSEEVNIKKTPWDSKPSTYLAVVKTLDKNMLSFQFVGWVYGYEVFKLPEVDPRQRGRPRYYRCENFRAPKNLLDMLLEISKYNPKEFK